MEQRNELSNLTQRQLLFPFISFQEYPLGFNPITETPIKRKRSKWGYSQMCRFWIYRIWKHEIISNYTTLMRMDNDSCFKNSTNRIYPLLPTLNQTLVYKSNRKGVDSRRFTRGIWTLVESYVNQHNITPQNPELWAFVKESDGRASYFNNFEISRVSFFQRDDVMRFQEHVTEMEPFGVFRKRWGDAVIRFITLAIFASPDQIDQSDTAEYYGHRYYGKRAECIPTDYWEFCPHCMFKGFTCLALAEHIANKYHGTLEDSKLEVMQLVPENCKK